MERELRNKPWNQIRGSSTRFPCVAKGEPKRRRIRCSCLVGLLAGSHKVKSATPWGSFPLDVSVFTLARVLGTARFEERHRNSLCSELLCSSLS